MHNTCSARLALAEPGDDVADASITWPATRNEIPFGTITLTARVDEQVPSAEISSILFPGLMASIRWAIRSRKRVRIST